MKRNTIGAISLAILLGAGLTGCKAKQLQLKDGYIPDFEYGDTLDKDDFLTEMTNGSSLFGKDVTIKVDGKKIKDDHKYAVGTHRVIIECSGYEPFEATFEVKDTRAPRISQKQTDMALNATDDLTSYFETLDESGDVKVTVDDSTLDRATAGSYKVKVTAEDKYGNKNEDEYTITVHDYDAEQKAAEEQAKQAEAELTDEERMEAEDQAYLFITQNYDVRISMLSTKFYTTKSEGEFIEVIITNVKDNQKNKHQFIVRMRSLPNHQVGSVYEVLCDGQYL